MIGSPEEVAFRLGYFGKQELAALKIGKRVPVHVLANWDKGLEDVIAPAAS